MVLLRSEGSVTDTVLLSGASVPDTVLLYQGNVTNTVLLYQGNVTDTVLLCEGSVTDTVLLPEGSVTDTQPVARAPRQSLHCRESVWSGPLRLIAAVTVRRSTLHGPYFNTVATCTSCHGGIQTHQRGDLSLD